MGLDRTSLGDVKDGRAARPHFTQMLLLFVHTINITSAVYYIHYIASIIHFVIAMLDLFLQAHVRRRERRD